MSGDCNKERYRYCPTQESVIKDVLKSIASDQDGKTRCEIERDLPNLLHGAIAQALCDLIERGQIQTASHYVEGSGWLTYWLEK